MFHSSRWSIHVAAGALVLVPLFAFSAEPTATETPLPRNDAAGNPLRRAPTGHVSNYDEGKVGPYTLPDPLVLKDGRPVRDAKAWQDERRSQILKDYETEIYGRVPAGAPKVTFEAGAPAPMLEGAAVSKEIVGRFGAGAEAPSVRIRLHLPAKAAAPAAVLLHLTFRDARPGTAEPGEGGPLADFIARGYGYATLRYTEIEGDSKDESLGRVRKLALAAGQTAPGADEWGTISAWAWGLSRVIDHLATDPAVDAKRIAVIGHSRLGKTALWTGAQDPRVALVFSSCSGEMGAALARRDYGETVDDMAANFPWQFAGNLQKYPGRWNDMPVDAHLLIALSAPRPVFITGGTQDQWADPRGMFLAAVAAGPVYRLLGAKDLGVTEGPPLDTPLIDGRLGFHYHTGGHTITPADWKAFLDFADRNLR